MPRARRPAPWEPSARRPPRTPYIRTTWCSSRTCDASFRTGRLLVVELFDLLHRLLCMGSALLLTRQRQRQLRVGLRADQQPLGLRLLSLGELLLGELLLLLGELQVVRRARHLLRAEFLGG